MGTITINVDDEIEKEFRKLANEESKGKKGFLGDAITEAMKKWISEKEQKEISMREIKILKKGFKLGKITYKKREELYGRK